MFGFLLEVILVSIVVSLFATWIKLVPSYPNWKYRFIQQGANTGILTVVLTLLFALKLYPGWVPLFGIILAVLALSVWIGDRAYRRNRPAAEEAMQAAGGK